MGLVNSAKQWVVEYLYDPWGKQVSCTGTLATTLGVDNPFRYRAYQYDQETGLYFLRSRYYNPGVGRFLNADGTTHTGQGPLGANMFAYCLNRPVNAKDPSGTISIEYAPTYVEDGYYGNPSAPVGSTGKSYPISLDVDIPKNRDSAATFDGYQEDDTSASNHLGFYYQISGDINYFREEMLHSNGVSHVAIGAEGLLVSNPPCNEGHGCTSTVFKCLFEVFAGGLSQCSCGIPGCYAEEEVVKFLSQCNVDSCRSNPEIRDIYFHVYFHDGENGFIYVIPSSAY